MRRFPIIAVFLWLLFPLPALAGLTIDITKGGLNPVPIAIPEFVDLGGAGSFGQQVSDVLTNDLKTSGLFRPIDRKAYLQDAQSLWKSGPSYRDWRLVGGEALVSGAIRREGTQISVDFFLYDVFQGGLIGTGKRFAAKEKDWRYLAHRVADEIYSRLTGEKGYFASRISLVAKKGDQRFLWVMDQDGFNRVTLTGGKFMVLTPRFSPDGERLFYLSYEGKLPRIFQWDLYSGKKKRLSDYEGLNSAPSWSPDGSKMALTLTKDGNAEIYVLHLSNGQLVRLTQHSGIDTSPSFSPDGRRIVFNSDRGGSPQLYVMDSDGNNVRRITYDGRYNAAPAWSPRGDLIAFVRGEGGRFNIAVIDPNGGQMRQLTNSWMDESPVWSPNGRVILFSRQTGNQTDLYSIDLTGHNERILRLPDGFSGSDPSWSPLIR